MTEQTAQLLNGSKTASNANDNRSALSLKAALNTGASPSVLAEAHRPAVVQVNHAKNGLNSEFRRHNTAEEKGHRNKGYFGIMAEVVIIGTLCLSLTGSGGGLALSIVSIAARTAATGLTLKTAYDAYQHGNKGMAYLLGGLGAISVVLTGTEVAAMSMEAYAGNALVGAENSLQSKIDVLEGKNLELSTDPIYNDGRVTAMDRVADAQMSANTEQIAQLQEQLSQVRSEQMSAASTPSFYDSTLKHMSLGVASAMLLPTATYQLQMAKKMRENLALSAHGGTDILTLKGLETNAVLRKSFVIKVVQDLQEEAHKETPQDSRKIKELQDAENFLKSSESQAQIDEIFKAVFDNNAIESDREYDPLSKRGDRPHVRMFEAQAHSPRAAGSGFWSGKKSYGAPEPAIA